MSVLKSGLPPKIYEVIERAELSPKQILGLSVWDIKKITNLRTDDILFVKNVAADAICPISTTSDLLLHQDSRVSTGCHEINRLIRGGFRTGTLTELYGESGSGKTQIGIQAAVHNSKKGCVYICTEDRFPVKRFEQIKQNSTKLCSEADNGKNVFVEHVTEAQDLLSCIKVRLPKLLQKNKPSLIVIDSIAAPFRSEYTNYVQRAEDLRELAMALISLAQKHDFAVICINQVTASFSSNDNILPTLGLAWSNMVSTRLWLKKTTQTVLTNDKSLSLEQHIFIRELHVVFAPDLQNSTVKLIITPRGVEAAK